MSISLTTASAIVVFIPLLISMIYYFRRDADEYAEFKKQLDTLQRQAFYRKWTVQSFLIYAVLTVVILMIFGRLNSLAVLPDEFSILSVSIKNSLFGGSGILDRQIPLVLISVFVVSALVSPTIIAFLSRRNSEPIMAGDIQPLLPRNKSEQVWGILISVNAGISEELFFRLLLPLLLVYVFGNAVIAFAASALLFGFVHAYQGWVGVIFTTIFGVILSLAYLGTGILWVAILAHAALNLNGLVLQPYLRSLIH